MVVSGHFHAFSALPLLKEPLYPLERGLSGLQSQSGCGEGKGIVVPMLN
jgi:hypothetical protein